MDTKSHDSENNTSIGSTVMRALRRLAEPVRLLVLPDQNELWAGRYQLIKELGRGGMGDVYLMRDVVLDRRIALKVLRTTSDESFVDLKRLLREARLAAQAEHPRVARVYDVGTCGEHSFIAMEYVPGETLRAWMKSRRPKTHEIVAIVHQLLDALQGLHQRGLVHRDLKPENLMVTPEGALRILDLGVARRVAIPEPESGALDRASISLGFGVGTPGYMAPEQWCQSDIDGRADIFAVGVIVYELVTDHSPFRGGTHLEIRERTLRGEVDFDVDAWKRVPAELREAVRIALARDRDERFLDVDSMVIALGSLIPPSLPPLSSPRPSGEPIATASTLSRSSIAISAEGIVVRKGQKGQARWLALGGAFVLAIGGVAVFHGFQPVLPATPGMVAFAGASYSMGLDRRQLDAQCRALPRGCPPHAQNEVPAHRVSVAPFELDVREVTNEEFTVFLNRIGSHTSVSEDHEEHYPRFVRYVPRPNEDYLLYDLYPLQAGIERTAAQVFSTRSGFEQLPVTLVTLLAAHLYCKSVGKRLPSEKEWELAAKGSEGRRFPWGNAEPRCGDVHIPSDKELPLLAPEACGNSRKTPFAVMTAIQDVTPQGIHDMGGNVFEWVDDDALLREESATDAARASVENPGINRGGAYDQSFTARTTGRAFWLANTPAFNVGFRCAKSIANKKGSFP